MKHDRFWDVIALLCVLIIVFTLVTVIGHIILKGLRLVNWGFLTNVAQRAGTEGGIRNIISATMYVTLLSLIFAVPVSVAAAIYLQEYARPGKLLNTLTAGIEALAGIPSIVFGLFGFGLFVTLFGWSWSLLSGGVTLALMALPIITRTSMEAIRSVPQVYREASLALGASQWQTITKIVLPTAFPAIITGVILSMGRVVGETAAVILTFGSTLASVSSIWDSGRSMPVHLFILAYEGVSVPRAYATGAVLLLFILILNGTAYIYQHYITKRLWRG